MSKAFLAIAFVAFASPALSQETPAEFFRNDPNRAGARVAVQQPAKKPVKHRGGGNSAFVASAQRHGVPVSVALATIRQESGGRCNARGSAGELGPLQIKPATARGLGYTGPIAALATCGAGLEWGMRHLALAYRKCGHVGPHNYGLYGGCRVTAYVRSVQRKMHGWKHQQQACTLLRRARVSGSWPIRTL